MRAMIEVITGPMFAGKSSELARRVRRYMLAGRRCVVIKHACDTRYGDEDVIHTHDGPSICAVKAGTLAVAEAQCKDAFVVAIDEGHFFHDLVPFCQRMADAGCIVIVAALDMTFRRDPWINVALLLARAESVTKLTAVCEVPGCGEVAAFTARTTHSMSTCHVGAHEAYSPRCAAHWELQAGCEKELCVPDNGGFPPGHGARAHAQRVLRELVEVATWLDARSGKLVQIAQTLPLQLSVVADPCHAAYADRALLADTMRGFCEVSRAASDLTQRITRDAQLRLETVALAPDIPTVRAAQHLMDGPLTALEAIAAWANGLRDRCFDALCAACENANSQPAMSHGDVCRMHAVLGALAYGL